MADHGRALTGTSPLLVAVVVGLAAGPVACIAAGGPSRSSDPAPGLPGDTGPVDGGVDPEAGPAPDGDVEPDGAFEDGAPEADGGQDGDETGPDFTALDRLLDDLLASGRPSGLAMQVFDAEDRLVYQREAGTCATPSAGCPGGSPPFTVDLVTGIASSTKWVTSTTVLATLEAATVRGELASFEEGLDEPITRWLDCGEAAIAPFDQVTLRQLLSFTSGVTPDHECVGALRLDGRPATLPSCACRILEDSAAGFVEDPLAGRDRDPHPPGTTYAYGSAHHTIAGAVVEAIEGRSWHDVFADRVAAPAGLEMRYRAIPNPNLAGSIQTSVADYARFVRAIFHDARDGTASLLSPAAAAEQRAPQVGEDVVVRVTPREGMAYGLNVWRWCTEYPTPEDLEAGHAPAPRPDCSQIFQVGHGGKGGYTPWIDVQADSYAVLAVREESEGGGADYEDTDALLGAVPYLVWAAMTSAAP